MSIDEMKELRTNYRCMMTDIKDRYYDSAKSHLLSWIQVVPAEEDETENGLLLSWELPAWYPEELMEDVLKNKLWMDGVDYIEWSNTENILNIVKLKDKL